MMTRIFSLMIQNLTIAIVAIGALIWHGQDVLVLGDLLAKASTTNSTFKMEKNSEPIRRTFQDVVEDVVPATVKLTIKKDKKDKQIAMGMIVNSRGWIITKSSECPDTGITCVLADGRKFLVESISRDQKTDLAILKIKARDLPVILRFNEKPLLTGQWAVTPGLDDLPIAIGVVSENSRKIGKHTSLLGITLAEDDNGVRIVKVFPNTAASRAGLKKGDILTEMAGRKLEKPQAVKRVTRDFAAGSTIKTVFTRDGKMQSTKVTLGEPVANLFSRSGFQNRMGTRLSRRREGFPSVFQHDCSLNPESCGGPIVDIDGRVIGLNIARAGRVETFAIPAKLLRKKIDSMIADHEEDKENNEL